MSERTVITTVEITKVYKNMPESIEMDKKEYAKNISRIVKQELNADDVVVTNVQEFVGGAV